MAALSRSPSLLLFTVFPPAALAPSGALAGEKLPPRAAQPAPPGEIDRTGYIKGLYVSAAAMGNADFMAHVHDLLENTELNAVVLDFKSDRGYMAFPTEVPLAVEIGADRDPQVKDPAEFMRLVQRTQRLHHRPHSHLQRQRADQGLPGLGHRRHGNGRCLARPGKDGLGRRQPDRGVGL